MTLGLTLCRDVSVDGTLLLDVVEALVEEAVLRHMLRFVHDFEPFSIAVANPGTPVL
jgi:hypothetical protein